MCAGFIIGLGAFMLAGKQTGTELGWNEADRNKKVCAKCTKTRINNPLEVPRSIWTYNIKYIVMEKYLKWW